MRSDATLTHGSFGGNGGGVMVSTGGLTGDRNLGTRAAAGGRNLGATTVFTLTLAGERVLPSLCPPIFRRNDPHEEAHRFRGGGARPGALRCGGLCGHQ